MLLFDVDILTDLETNRNIPNLDKIVIHPFDERCLSPVGYDLRAGDAYQLLHEGITHMLVEGEKISIPPGETVSIRTLEWLAMPPDGMTAGMICSRVTLVSKGATHVSTTVDPDWFGNLIISFSNNSKAHIEIPFGERICTVVFFRMDSQARKRSQHAPGRPDALSQNASKVAENYKSRKRRGRLFLYGFYFIFSIAYMVIVYWASIRFGQSDLFAALVAGGVILSGVVMQILSFFIERR